MQFYYNLKQIHLYNNPTVIRKCGYHVIFNVFNLLYLLYQIFASLENIPTSLDQVLLYDVFPYFLGYNTVNLLFLPFSLYILYVYCTLHFNRDLLPGVILLDRLFRNRNHHFFLLNKRLSCQNVRHFHYTTVTFYRLTGTVFSKFPSC